MTTAPKNVIQEELFGPAPRLIKDPLHGYILISQLEHRIINDPMFLRLQYITQQGLAYLTYPSNRTSRFAHSIGAMHLAGLMALNLLGEEKLLKEVDRVILTPYLELRTRSELEAFVRNENDPLYRHYRLDASKLTAIILFQSIRIAALIYDVGHLPFSHALEEVIGAHITQEVRQSKWYAEFRAAYSSLQHEDVTKALESQGAKGQIPRVATKVHEAIGRLLTVHIFKRVLTDHERLFGETCLKLALEISRADEDANDLLSCLHSLVGGQIDSDRLDFIDRDGYASGLGFGGFDRDRIISALRLHSNNGEYRIRPTTSAMSAVEAFFLERYRNHRWLVFHHNVARGDIAVARSLDILLTLWFRRDAKQNELTKELIDLLERYDISRLWRQFADETDEKKELDFASCDEPWLYLILREADQIVRSYDETEDSTDIASLRVCLGMACRREKSSLISLWKRIEEYKHFADAFYLTCKDGHFDDWFASRTPDLRQLRNAGNSSIKFLNSVLSEGLRESLKKDKLTTLQNLEQAISSRFDGRVLLHISLFTPVKPYELIDSKGDLINMSELSSLWAHLNEIAENDIRLQAFFIPIQKRGRESKRVIDKKKIIEKLGRELAIAICAPRRNSKAFKEKKSDTPASNSTTRKPNYPAKSPRSQRRTIA